MVYLMSVFPGVSAPISVWNAHSNYGMLSGETETSTATCGKCGFVSGLGAETTDVEMWRVEEASRDPCTEHEQCVCYE